MSIGRVAEVKTITQSQYLQLLGLLEIAKEAQKRMVEIVKSAVEITGEKDEHGLPELSGHTSDIMYDSRGLDEGLRIMKITVAANETQTRSHDA